MSAERYVVLVGNDQLWQQTVHGVFHSRESARAVAERVTSKRPDLRAVVAAVHAPSARAACAAW